MDQQDNNPLDQRIADLEKQFREVLAAENFAETQAGQLWFELATAEVNRILIAITSDKFEKDHMGYLKALADLQAYKKMIRKMQLAASPKRKQRILDAMPEKTDASV